MLVSRSHLAAFSLFASNTMSFCLTATNTLAFGYILPTAGRIRNFHPLEHALTGRTICDRKPLPLGICGHFTTEFSAAYPHTVYDFSSETGLGLQALQDSVVDNAVGEFCKFAVDSFCSVCAFRLVLAGNPDGGPTSNPPAHQNRDALASLLMFAVLG